MAVLAAGRIQLQGAPDALLASLRGCVWRKVIAKAELDGTGRSTMSSPLACWPAER